MTIELPADLLNAVSRLTQRLPRSILGELEGALAKSGGLAQARDALRSSGPVLAPESRALVEALLAEWSSATPSLSGREVALLLIAMGWQADALRGCQRVDLVWSGPELPGQTFRSTEQRVVELIDGATRAIWIVAFAAYRVASLVAALERALMRRVRLNFVVESANESLGRVTFDPMTAFGPRIGRAANVYVWPLERRPRDNQGRHGTLHAKCVIVDGRAIFVSSANFTEYAMKINLELGASVESEETAGAAERLLEQMVTEGVLCPL